MKKHQLFLLANLASAAALQAAVTDNLIAYYNFEETGAPGIANKVSGASTHHGAYLNGTSFGAGAGFAGNAAFAGAEAAASTNRSTLLVGNALNIAKSDTSTTAGSGQFSVTTLTSRGTPPTPGDFGTLGTQFAISAWFYLAPDADNTGSNTDVLRDFVFESRLNGPDSTAVFDISFGTTDAAGTTYASYVASVTTATHNRSLAAGAWHHVVHSFATSGANTVMTVYIDGELVGTATQPTTAMDFRGINFGANRSGARIFDGMMDEIGIWNRALSPAEATLLFQLGSSGQAITSSQPTIELGVSPAAAGNVAGSGLYSAGSQAAISATPNPGYVFSSWSGDFTGQPASFTHTVTSSVNATANFGEDTTDSDNDGLSNYLEIIVHQTLPNNPDTDGDRIPDGAEVNITTTNPKIGDDTLVNFVEQNLSTGQAGKIGLSPLRIDRDPLTGQISLFLSLKGSATAGIWQDIDLSHPSVSIVPAGDGWDLTFPAPSNTLNSYLVVPEQP